MEESYKIQDYLSDWEVENGSSEIKILNAAIKNFSEKGFHGTKTKDIAKTAGVAEGTIFRYFQTKDDLLVKMVPLLLRILLPKLKTELWNELLKEGKCSAKQIMIRIVQNRVHLIRRNSTLLLAVMPEIIYRESLRNQILSRVKPEIIEMLEKIYESFVMDQHKIEKSAFVRFTLATVASYAFQGMLVGKDLSYDAIDQDIESYMSKMSKDWSDEDDKN